MSKAKFADLVDEIRQFGYRQPILCREKNAEGKYVIIDGEHRYRALCSLPEYADQLITINIKNCSDNDAKINTITMNKIHGNLDPYKMSLLVKDMAAEYEMEEIAKMTKMSEAELQHYFELKDLRVMPDESLRETGVVEELNEEKAKNVTLNFNFSEADEAILIEAKSKLLTIGSDKDFILSIARYAIRGR